MMPSSHDLVLCYRNVIHGSDSIESANKEIALWFPEGPADWQSSQHPWIYEK
jgi:nucleoside-diphosphate kinase